MISAINTALQGLQQNQQTFTQHADRISKWGTQDPTATPPNQMINLQEELVGVMQSQRGYEANLPVIRAADEMLGTLLDTFA